MRSSLKFINTGCPLSCQVPLQSKKWRIMNEIFLEIRCMISGFLKIDTGEWNFPQETPLILDNIPNIIDMNMREKLETINRLHTKYKKNMHIIALDK